jgi:UDP-N-acetylmuramyl tripeptide synthase
VEAARKKGASAIASEQPAPPVAVAAGPGRAQALALLFPAVSSARIPIVAVTGTNGKTTTTYLIDAALRAAGHKVGLIGTVQYRIGDRLADATRSTPEASDLQALLREMVDAGCSHAVLEVSSHSLELQRVAGCAFQVAVFTNLTRDHLDFHGDMDSYFQAKRKLFAELVRPDGRSVINADDDRAAELTAASRAPCGPTASTSRRTSGPKTSAWPWTARASACGARWARTRWRAPWWPLQRPERAGRLRGGVAAAVAGRRPARPGHRDGRARPAGARGGPPACGDRGLRPHRRRAQEPAGDGARAGPSRVITVFGCGATAIARNGRSWARWPRD